MLFLLHEALTNFRRHGLMTMAAITTIAVSLALLGGFLLTFYQVSNAARRAVDAFEMRVFCRQEIRKEALPALKQRITALQGVASVRYLSREQIWAEQTKNYPIDTSGIPNQMPDTFVVKLSDARRATALSEEIRNWRESVDSVDLPESEMNSVLRIADFLRNVGMAGAFVLVGGALIVVSNTIRISVFARRREIKIMQLVGATPWFIRFPLLIEGMLHGLLGGALAALCLLGAGHSLGNLVRENVPMLVPYLASVDMLRFGLALALGGALLGAGGSLVSIRRYLRAL